MIAFVMSGQGERKAGSEINLVGERPGALKWQTWERLRNGKREVTTERPLEEEKKNRVRCTMHAGGRGRGRHTLRGGGGKRPQTEDSWGKYKPRKKLETAL